MSPLLQVGQPRVAAKGVNEYQSVRHCPGCFALSLPKWAGETDLFRRRNLRSMFSMYTCGKSAAKERTPGSRKTTQPSALAVPEFLDPVKQAPGLAPKPDLDHRLCRIGSRRNCCSPVLHPPHRHPVHAETTSPAQRSQTGSKRVADVINLWGSQISVSLDGWFPAGFQPRAVHHFEKLPAASVLRLSLSAAIAAECCCCSILARYFSSNAARGSAGAFL